MAADWSNGPQGPGWFVKFASFVSFPSPMVGGGSGSEAVGNRHTFQRDKHFPDKPMPVSEFDEDLVIALSLLEL